MPHLFASRLDKLLDLRERLDAEIAEERARVKRIERQRSLNFKAQDRLARRQKAKEERERLRANRPPAAEVREWARANGVPVGLRGQIKPEVYDAYFEAHHPLEDVL